MLSVGARHVPIGKREWCKHALERQACERERARRDAEDNIARLEEATAIAVEVGITEPINYSDTRNSGSTARRKRQYRIAEGTVEWIKSFQNVQSFFKKGIITPVQDDCSLLFSNRRHFYGC